MRLRDLTRTGWFQRAAGFAAAEFLRFVWLTNRFELDPPDLYQRVEPDMPLIVAFWHGQHFMMPFLRRHYPATVLISRHRDGEMNAIAAERLRVGTVSRQRFPSQGWRRRVQIDDACPRGGDQHGAHG
jgi:lysophospholipid acyltransferase (LPLAT)-like uncharacterized protein